MSKKNNKKNSTRKSYKIESLEPRLMMDAAASQWLEEIDSIALSETAVTALGDDNFYSRTNWNSKGDVTGLYLQDEESGEVETTRARLKELVRRNRRLEKQLAHARETAEILKAIPVHLYSTTRFKIAFALGIVTPWGGTVVPF